MKQTFLLLVLAIFYSSAHSQNSKTMIDSTKLVANALKRFEKIGVSTDKIHREKMVLKPVTILYFRQLEVAVSTKNN